MATQRYISTSFWDDGWIHKLDPSEKLLYLYFMTNPLTNIAGVYQITLDRMIFDTGFNENTIKHILEKFEVVKKCYYRDGWLILPSWPKHQKWQQRSKIKQGIDICLSSTPKNIISLLSGIGYAYPIDMVSYPMDTLRYPSNYSDSEFDSDSDTESDSDTDTPASPPPVFSRSDALNPNRSGISQEVEADRHHWNEIGAKPPKEKLIMNFEGITQTIQAYTRERRHKAMDNYDAIRKSPDHELRPEYGSLDGFLREGVEKYVEEADPWTRCKIKPKVSPIPEKRPSVEVPDSETTRKSIDSVRKEFENVPDTNAEEEFLKFAKENPDNPFVKRRLAQMESETFGDDEGFADEV